MCERDSAKGISIDPIILRLPDHLCKWKDNRNVSIDRCISNQIEELWKANVETLGCCCGHGQDKLGGISVIVDEKYSDSDIHQIVSIIEKHDGREWNVLQWRNSKLEKVGVSNA